MSGTVGKQPEDQCSWSKGSGEGTGEKKVRRIRNEAKERTGSQYSAVPGQSKKLGLTQRIINR